MRFTASRQFGRGAPADRVQAAAHRELSVVELSAPLAIFLND